MEQIILSFFLALALPAPAHRAPLLVTRIEMPGVVGRIDHLALDRKHDRLIVAALGNNTVEILDLRTGKTLQSVGGLSEPQGVLYDEQTDTLLVTSGGDGTLRTFDCRATADPAKPCRLAGTIPGLPDADNIRRDPATQAALVGYGDGSLGILSAGQTLVASVPVGGHPESFQVAAKTPLTYVNVPDAGKICVVDRSRRIVLSNWPTGSRAGNFPMAFDEAGGILFVGFRHPAELLVLSTAAGKEIAHLDCVGDADDIFFDGGTAQVYVSGGEGYVDIFARTPGAGYERVDRITTRKGARTSFLDSEKRRLFVAVPRLRNAPAEILVFRIP